MKKSEQRSRYTIKIISRNYGDEQQDDNESRQSQDYEKK